MIAISSPLQNSSICLLTQKPISKPGYLHCKHKFEKSAISLWLTSGGTGCPLCREVCCISEVSDTFQEAVEEAECIAEETLRAGPLAEEIERIKIRSETTFAQALEARIARSLRQVSSLALFTSEDWNHIYWVFMTRVFTKFVQNLEPLKAMGMACIDLKAVSAAQRQRFELDYIKIYNTHLVSSRSPLLLHALIEDKAMHRAIVPPAYEGLTPCRSPVSSRELSREYMLCEQIQRLDRDVALAESGIKVPHLPPFTGSFPLGRIINMFKILQEARDQLSDEMPHAQQYVMNVIKQLYPYWHERIQTHFRNEQRLQGSPEEMNSVEGGLCTSEEGVRAFTHMEIEFVLSVILLLSVPNDEDRKEFSKALEVLEGLEEQIKPPKDDRKVAIAQRLYQILGDLLPAQGEDESSEERGRSLLPLIFHAVHPTAILYAIAQLRSELYADWEFSDPVDYPREWLDLQQKLINQGYL